MASLVESSIGVEVPDSAARFDETFAVAFGSIPLWGECAESVGTSGSLTDGALRSRALL